MGYDGWMNTDNVKLGFEKNCREGEMYASDLLIFLPKSFNCRIKLCIQFVKVWDFAQTCFCFERETRMFPLVTFKRFDGHSRNQCHRWSSGPAYFRPRTAPWLVHVRRAPWGHFQLVHVLIMGVTTCDISILSLSHIFFISKIKLNSLLSNYFSFNEKYTVHIVFWPEVNIKSVSLLIFISVLANLYENKLFLTVLYPTESLSDSSVILEIMDKMF